VQALQHGLATAADPVHLVQGNFSSSYMAALHATALQALL
jgi:hypothetical protein